jgi:2-keto-4-pentenoate hydratase/2-oxohepta-3-ene-1,7-dioic acid hydratase in catechol pathway
MRIGSLRANGMIRPVSLRGDEIAFLDTPIRELLGRGLESIKQADARAKETASLSAVQGQLAPAITNPGKVICIGRNYAEHAAETGHVATPKPDVFLRTRTSLCGPYDPIRKPKISDSLDYEVELAVVIGKGGRHISAADAMQAVGGFCVFNDGSVRDWQTAGTQWTPGKNFDSTGPLGPFIVTPDEVPDPHNLELSTSIGDEVLQKSNTSMLIHKVPDLIAFLSAFTTLEPGDVICTGTPAGVGMARSPQRWLVAGETVVCSITGLGDLRNPIVAD